MIIMFTNLLPHRRLWPRWNAIEQHFLQRPHTVGQPGGHRRRTRPPHLRLKDYATALLTHFGHWMQPERRQDKGPRPKPRWMPLPALLYAQVVKSYRRRRLVGVTHRVVFGTRLAIEQVLAACGWRINTAFVEVRPVGRKEVPASG
jgi:hypothetical protein